MAHSTYGGISQIKGRKTGFFHVESIDGRFWLIDPEGDAFWAVGLNRVDYRSTPDLQGVEVYHENVKKLFGSEDAWAKHTTERIQSWNFNMNARATTPRMPYATWCSASHTFARTKCLLKSPGVPGYMTFVDIFDPDFARNYAKVCKQNAVPRRDDPRLIGYYTDNELFWGCGWESPHSLFDAVLFQSPETFNKRDFAAFFQVRYSNNLALLNQTWHTRFKRWDDLLRCRELRTFNDGVWADKRAFLFHYARHYFKTVNALLKAADPNHLNLGCRVHGWCEIEVARAMGEFVDVVSYNKYDRFAPQYQMGELFGRYGGKPVLVSEWGFRSTESDLPNTGGVGRIVATQKIRGERYARFIEGLARSPCCVGSVFYAYVDDPAGGGGGMMVNENSNYGLVDVRDKPYADFVKAVAKANSRIYQWRQEGPKREDSILIATPRDFHREPLDSFFVQRNGRVINNEYIRAFLLSRDAGRDYQTATFAMDFAKPVRFLACVYQVEKNAILEFRLDGKAAARFSLPAGRNQGQTYMKMPKGWQSMYDKEFGIRIPAGPHTITVRNAGKGWIWLDGYRVTRS